VSAAHPGHRSGVGDALPECPAPAAAPAAPVAPVADIRGWDDANGGGEVDFGPRLMR